MKPKEPPQQANGPRYMTLLEVATELGLKSRSAIYPKIYSGEIAAVPVGKNGRGLRVLRSSFEEYCRRLERDSEQRFGGAA